MSKNKIGVCMLQQRNKALLRAQDVARWMVLSTSETKVCNEVLVPEPFSSKNFKYFLARIKSTMKSSTRRLMQPFKQCCNVLCKPAEWFICFTKLYTNVRAASN